MIVVGKTLISEDLFEEKFVCDLNACKGECCVQGDAGAPLELEELDRLDEVYDDVKPYLRPEGIHALESEGLYTQDIDGEYVTTLRDGKECAYVVYDDRGVALCGIEKAFRDGKVNWPKPVSCHLYPIRITKLKDFDAVNYHRWQICEPACECGSKLEVPVFKFLQHALTRKFGEEWFGELSEVYKLWRSENQKESSQ